MLRFFRFPLPFLLLAMSLVSCRRPSYESLGGYAQGGVWQVKCRVPAGIRKDVLQKGLDSALTAIDASLSGYNQSSVLSRHNRGELPLSAGASLSRDEVLAAGYDTLFLRMLALSRAAWELTGGKVDASAAELFDAWGFGFKNDSLPPVSRTDSLRALGGNFSLRRGDGSPRRFNFNALAQGYSSDLLARYLRSKGIGDMLVNVGGEMFCAGVNPSGKAWTLGIDTPYDGNDAPGEKLSRIFEVRDVPAAVVTSGNYRKFYVRDGVKYSHTIDPGTGRPVSHDLLSATVIVGAGCPLTAPGAAFERWETTLADALATYCMVVGPEAAKAFVTAQPGIEACLISGAGQEGTEMEVWCSEGFGAVR